MRHAWLLGLCAAGALAQTAPVPLAPVFVTATRAADPAEYVPFSHQTLTGDTLRQAANVTVDGALRQIPGFSLFRRSDSLVANPTTQGVSLRGLGPSGASRSLILLDGVPLNDPFGGWVLWSKVPRESLAAIELVPGAGGTAWGNAALGGVIQLFTESPAGERERFAARGGSFDTYDFEGQLTEPAGPGTLQLLGRSLSTRGYFTVAAERRGPIDQPVTSRSHWLTGRWRQALGPGMTATLTVRRFGDDRGNGTPYQRNHSAETFASLALAAQVSASFQWNATAYAQDQNFTSTFSSVNATRTAETPASNQFAVPADALGLAWVGEWIGTPDARTSVGFDLRDVRGETREDSGWVTDAFTRRRFAGGRQSTAGVFAIHRRSVGAARVSLGLRADDWQDTAGHRRDLVAGVPTGDEHFARRDGVALSPSVGVTWPVSTGLRFHVSGQRAFRRPTLNELYRPFRVGNVITDANPNLRTETVTSGEIGLTAERGMLTFNLTGFWNELQDSVANVTIAQGPANVPGIGFVPAGGEGRRKMNLDRTRVRGTAVATRWKISPALAVEVQYLYNDATVTRASVAPWLSGLRLAQVPRQSASAGLEWHLGRWSVAPRARWIGAQYEDDTNRLELAAATVVDLSATAALGRQTEIFVSAENIFDHRIETGRSADGLVNVGTPRLILVGFRVWR